MTFTNYLFAIVIMLIIMALLSVRDKMSNRPIMPPKVNFVLDLLGGAAVVAGCWYFGLFS